MKYFNDKMTYSEAFSALCRAGVGKSEAERKEIISEYNSVIGTITENDLKRNEGYMTSYHIVSEKA